MKVNQSLIKKGRSNSLHKKDKSLAKKSTGTAQPQKMGFLRKAWEDYKADPPKIVMVL